MEDNKSWWQSKSVWGGIVAVLASIASVVGVSLDAGTQELVATALVGVAGAAAAIIGRVKATKPIGPSQ